MDVVKYDAFKPESSMKKAPYFTISTGICQQGRVVAALTTKFSAHFQNRRLFHGALWIEGAIIYNIHRYSSTGGVAFTIKFGARFQNLRSIHGALWLEGRHILQHPQVLVNRGGAAPTTKLCAHFQNRRSFHGAVWLEGAIFYNIRRYLSTGGGGAHHQSRRSLPNSAFTSWSYLA